jgi:uncharacterized protein YceH (UPF0502 family)
MEESIENIESADESMLTAMEARILGSLMEKQLTTPDAYPLTLNSLLLACNQKTSREPVTHYEQGEVQRCLSQLQDKNLVYVDYSSRAAKYDQRLTRVLSFDKATQAILNVMLLRGPQTLAELLSRTQRMFEFENIQAVEEKLDYLCNKTTPHFIRIPKAAGQREDRFMHLLCGKPDLTAIAAMANSDSRASSSSGDNQELENKIKSLEDEIIILKRQIKTLMDLNGVEDSDIS